MEGMPLGVLIVSPVRIEAPHMERVVRADAAQEVPPARWIIIDDASTDATLGTPLDRFRADPQLGLARGVLVELAEDGGLRPCAPPSVVPSACPTRRTAASRGASSGRV
jgi:hypothetical protein